jgi:hypothetical protein
MTEKPGQALRALRKWPSTGNSRADWQAGTGEKNEGSLGAEQEISDSGNTITAVSDSKSMQG